ncbi:hypothetical protein DVH24_022196 [Malus domestica]|uniref:Germin-like protein n=1 Tax=Malus domestica TaxID=3750 RepID=A0A498IZG0_MALDO|nr:hypothetical protein DVH24_022196 [Malus domestica]
MASQILLLTTLLAITCSLVVAFEPSPLQDFCVANATSLVVRWTSHPAHTSNPVGGKVTPVNVAQIPGLNTLGISLARINYAPMGVIQRHTHPRATEILTVLKGKLNVGFVTSSAENKLISKKVLKKGDVFVFPVGLVHHQQNLGSETAIALSSLSSQNPEVYIISN